MISSLSGVHGRVGEVSIALLIDQGLFICPRNLVSQDFFITSSDLLFSFSLVKACQSFAINHPVCLSAFYLYFCVSMRISDRIGVITDFVILSS